MNEFLGVVLGYLEKIDKIFVFFILFLGEGCDVLGLENGEWCFTKSSLVQHNHIDIIL